MALPPVVALYEDHFRSGDPDAVLAYGRVFAETEFLLAGEQRGENGEIALMSFEPEGQPALLATFDREIGANVLNIDPASFVPMPGKLLLTLVQQQRVNLYVVYQPDAEQEGLMLLNHELLALGQILMINDGRQDSGLPTVAGTADVPHEFSRWLYEYCVQQPDIRRAHMTLVSMGNVPIPHVAVLLDAADAAIHWPRFHASSNLLLPGQLLLDGASETFCWPDGIVDSILNTAPLYCSSQRRGWWSRLKRRLRPAPVVHVRMALSDE